MIINSFFCTFWLVFVTFSIFFSFEYHKSLPVWCEFWQVWWFSTGESHKRSEASESERFFSSFLYSEASTELFLSSWSWLNEQRWVKIKQQKYDFLMNRKWSCTSSMQMQNEVWVIKSTKTNTRMSSSLCFVWDTLSECPKYKKNGKKTFLIHLFCWDKLFLKVLNLSLIWNFNYTIQI